MFILVLVVSQVSRLSKSHRRRENRHHKHIPSREKKKVFLFVNQVASLGASNAGFTSSKAPKKTQVSMRWQLLKGAIFSVTDIYLCTTLRNGSCFTAARAGDSRKCMFTTESRSIVNKSQVSFPSPSCCPCIHKRRSQHRERFKSLLAFFGFSRFDARWGLSSCGRAHDATSYIIVTFSLGPVQCYQQVASTMKNNSIQLFITRRHFGGSRTVDIIDTLELVAADAFFQWSMSMLKPVANYKQDNFYHLRLFISRIH